MSLYGSPSQPDFAAALATIQGWDKDRLQELLNDEEKFDALIKGLSQIKSLHDEKEMLMASNRSLAEYNLSQEPVLKDLKSQLADKHREAMRTAEKVKNAKRELDEKSGSVEPDTLLALLQVRPYCSPKVTIPNVPFFHRLPTPRPRRPVILSPMIFSTSVLITWTSS